MVIHGFSELRPFPSAPSARLQEVERLARKFRLDDPVASRFTELIHRRKKDGGDRSHAQGGPGGSR